MTCLIFAIFIIYQFSQITSEGLIRQWIKVENVLSFLRVQGLCKNLNFWQRQSNSSPSAHAKNHHSQFKMSTNPCKFGKLVITPVATVSPVDDTVLPSYMLAAKSTNAGMSVVGWLRECSSSWVCNGFWCCQFCCLLFLDLGGESMKVFVKGLNLTKWRLRI